MMNNILSLQGKHILVTGASSGMGRVFAQMIAAQGGKVSLLARNEKRLSETIDSMGDGGHQSLVCDLTDEKQLEEAVTRMDVLDGIVLSAGINEFVPLKYIKQEKFIHLFQTNFFSQLILLQKLLKKKLINREASLVCISSLSSLLGVPGSLVYSSSKGALNSAVKVMASELAGQKIRVNAICPGIVKTEMLARTNIDEDTFTKQESQYPLGLGTPEDVGNLVLFLLSDASRWMTGQQIIMDGGFTLTKG